MAGIALRRPAYVCELYVLGLVCLLMRAPSPEVVLRGSVGVRLATSAEANCLWRYYRTLDRAHAASVIAPYYADELVRVAGCSQSVDTGATDLQARPHTPGISARWCSVVAISMHSVRAVGGGYRDCMTAVPFRMLYSPKLFELSTETSNGHVVGTLAGVPWVEVCSCDVCNENTYR